MSVKPRTPEETYERALQKAQLAFPALKPQDAAARAGVTYQLHTAQEGEFQIPFFGRGYQVLWPDGAVRGADPLKETDIATRILLLHYLLTAEGIPLADRWIAFRNLPGGLGYDAAFQGRANLRLARVFGADRAAFEAAARAMGGERLSFGDASFAFPILPRVWLAVVLYLADEEFPASANVLFDAAASHYLPTEDLAVLGGMLAGRLTKAAQAR
jgi:Domain of unknown function (DUF3786)